MFNFFIVQNMSKFVVGKIGLMFLKKVFKINTWLIKSTVKIILLFKNILKCNLSFRWIIINVIKLCYYILFIFYYYI